MMSSPLTRRPTPSIWPDNPCPANQTLTLRRAPNADTSPCTPMVVITGDALTLNAARESLNQGSSAAGIGTARKEAQHPPSEMRQGESGLKKLIRIRINKVTKQNLRAITLHRPWGLAIAQHGKDIENRSWQPYPSTLKPGDLLAIHNGQKWDKEGARFIWELLGIEVKAEDDPAGAIIAVVRFDGCVESSPSPWFVGHYGWLLSQRVPIPAIACKSQQGLWVVTDPVLSQVRAAYKEAKVLTDGIR